MGDILQLALSGHIKLSVCFQTPTWAHECEIVTYDVEQLNSEIAIGIYTEKLQWREWNGGIERSSLNLGGNKFLNVYDRFISLQGIYDLPFFGDVWLCVSKKWSEFIGNAPTNQSSHYGIFLEGRDGLIFRLRDGINFSEYQESHLIKQRDLKRHIAENNINKDNAGVLLGLQAEEREAWLKTRHKANLPDDSVFVMRLDALREFELSISDNENGGKPKKPHGNTEINAQKREQILGAALSVLANWPEQCKNNAGEIEGTKIRKLIEEKALLFWKETGEPPLSTEKIEREIRKWLNTVK